jgi:NAD(P)-dependent dehydrogenase (short-subunit alcohol dehydrogenase family)
VTRVTGRENHPTADEVLAGVDLSGRTAVVTGGYSGIGPATVGALSRAGARVLVPARRPGEAREVLRDVANAHLISVGEMDLSDQASVAAYAESVLALLTAEGAHVDIVINSAGIMATPETRTPEGWELQLATNHLGHFALVNRLWPLLAGNPGGARVVSVSSGGHQFSDIRWDDPWFETGYDKWHAYGQSKTANALFAIHLDAVGRAHGVRAWSLHPGAILTPLGRHLQAEDLATVMVEDENGELVLPTFKTPEQGAATSVWAATSPDVLAFGGRYLEDVALAPSFSEGDVRPSDAVGVKDYAQDPVSAARLWGWSAELTGLDALS